MIVRGAMLSCHAAAADNALDEASDANAIPLDDCADMQKYNEMCKLSNGPYRALFAGQ